MSNDQDKSSEKQKDALKKVSTVCGKDTLAKDDSNPLASGFHKDSA